MIKKYILKYGTPYCIYNDKIRVVAGGGLRRDAILSLFFSFKYLNVPLLNRLIQNVISF